MENDTDNKETQETTEEPKVLNDSFRGRLQAIVDFVESE